MNRRFKSLVLVSVIAIGAFVGAPLSVAAAEGRSDTCAMKCCKKTVKAGDTSHRNTKQLCNLMNCGDSVPSAPGAAQPNVQVVGNFKLAVAPDFQLYFPNFARPPNPPPLFVPTASPKRESLFIIHSSFLI
ncbi:MAG: hypothetical protein R2684_13780 [Pyrinomonadaceae bacterium]